MLAGFSLLSPKIFGKSRRTEIDFLRHATFTLRLGDVTLLVDPMLSARHAMDPVGNCRNVERIPMVDLPISEEVLTERLKSVNAILVTHTHRDHWDTKAQSLLAKQLPIICQPSDSQKFREQGFTNLRPVDTESEFQGLKIVRTDGQHGRGEIGVKMGPVSGFIIEFEKKKIYIAGDTIWCSSVENAISTHKPDVIVLNAGAAQFDQGDPITMTSGDVVKTIQAIPAARVIAVHMETVNHCWMKRDDLKKELEGKKLSKKCLIPRDGEKIHLT